MTAASHLNASPDGHTKFAADAAMIQIPSGDAPNIRSARQIILRAVGSAILAATLLAPSQAGAEPIAPGAIHVIDGDTIAVGKVHYRLVGFDTPETTHRARCKAEREMGAEATRRLRLIVSKGGLDLSEVPCSCAPGTAGTFQCNYGRRCGVLTQAGRDVGDTLMADGLARPYPFDWRTPPAHPDWCGAEAR